MIYPPSPVPMVASEGADEGDIYDMCTHLSPVSTPPKEGSSASAPPGLEARAASIAKDNAALGRALPPLRPPDAPRLPAARRPPAARARHPLPGRGAVMQP
eukprot:3804517-Pyramimonas_sp.AAC.1